MHYTVKEAAELLKVSERAIQKRCKRDGLTKSNGKWLIAKINLEQWSEPETNNRPNQGEPTAQDEPGEIIESFSLDEYEEFKKRLTEYPILLERLKDYRNEIEYLKKSLDKQAEQMDKVLGSVQKSIESLHLAFDNVKRDQYLKHLDKK